MKIAHVNAYKTMWYTEILNLLKVKGIEMN